MVSESAVCHVLKWAKRWGDGEKEEASALRPLLTATRRIVIDEFIVVIFRSAANQNQKPRAGVAVEVAAFQGCLSSSSRVMGSFFLMELYEECV